ncbi:MAG: prolyl oligopeptidase family serine peptidase [Granulosicoccaceae bacterium]
MTTTAPYGSWRSPISAESLVQGAAGISEVVPDEDAVWWCESRPSEGGRSAMMRWHDGSRTEVTAPDANVRTRVHEYGGGAWTVYKGIAYYVDDSDQRIRKLMPDQSVQLLSQTPDTPRALRYADLTVTPDEQWIIAVGEHHLPNGHDVDNFLVAIKNDGSETHQILAEGADFYQSPVVSPDGKQLAWTQWQHPNLPWDDTELFVAKLCATHNSIAVSDIQLLAGGKDEAIVQPLWSPSGVLHFLSDKSDLWQLYQQGRDAPVTQLEGEIGYPPWVFGLARYAFTDTGSVIAARFDGGVEYLDGYPQYTAFNSVRTSGAHVAFAAAGWQSETVVIFDGQIVNQTRQLAYDEAFMPTPEVISYDTSNNEQSYALYFPPANPAYTPEPSTAPPLIVLAHGGPTSAARSHLNLGRNFWTSRGFAVVDVNYRGSSGFGRSYRKKLEGNWGVYDVDDCINAAHYLAALGKADENKLIIRGGSAGGFTVLCALAMHSVFTAGANMYGVANLEDLAGDTHKFESRYLDRLIGPYPERKTLYQERSPINHLEGLTAPMIVLQGDEDAIVPPAQSRKIVEALKARKIPVAYIEFEGEQHGFRKAENIITALESELYFYGQVFGFTPADIETTVEIFGADLMTNS